MFVLVSLPLFQAIRKNCGDSGLVPAAGALKASKSTTFVRDSPAEARGGETRKLGFSGSSGEVKVGKALLLPELLGTKEKKRDLRCDTYLSEAEIRKEGPDIIPWKEFPLPSWQLVVCGLLCKAWPICISFPGPTFPTNLHLGVLVLWQVTTTCWLRQQDSINPSEYWLGWLRSVSWQFVRYRYITLLQLVPSSFNLGRGERDELTNLSLVCLQMPIRHCNKITAITHKLTAPGLKHTATVHCSEVTSIALPILNRLLKGKISYCLLIKDLLCF